jgi:hypothetical protein
VELASGWERLITGRVMNADAAPPRPYPFSADTVSVNSFLPLPSGWSVTHS